MSFRIRRLTDEKSFWRLRKRFLLAVLVEMTIWVVYVDWARRVVFVEMTKRDLNGHFDPDFDHAITFII